MNSKTTLSSKAYRFIPTSKQIVFNISINKEDILLITNITANTLIYNFTCDTKGATFNSNTLTLTYDTSEMNSSDELLVIIKDIDKKETYLKEIRDLLKELIELTLINSK